MGKSAYILVCQSLVFTQSVFIYLIHFHFSSCFHVIAFLVFSFFLHFYLYLSFILPCTVQSHKLDLHVGFET